MARRRKDAGPRKETPTSALRFDKAGAASPDKAKRGPSWKKTAARAGKAAEEKTAAPAEVVKPGQTAAVEPVAGAVPAPAPLDAAITPDDTAEAEEQAQPAERPRYDSGGRPARADPPPPTSGQSVPKLRQDSKRAGAVSGHSAAEGAFRQESAGAAAAAGDAPPQGGDTGQRAPHDRKRRAGDTVRHDAAGQAPASGKLRRESKRAEAVSEHSAAEGAFRQESAGAVAPAGEIPRQGSDAGQRPPRDWKRQAGDAVRRDEAGQAPASGKFRQESKQAPPADRLHHDGAGPEPDKLRREKGRMERRGGRLEKARGRLEKQKPVKPPGPVKRAAGAVGYGVHGYVHRKLYEVEYENVGTEAAHRSELAAETVGRSALRFTRQRVRSHPARAVRKAEGRYAKSVADYHFKQTVLEHPEMEKKNALSRMWRKRQQRKKYAKQAREAAKQGARAAEKTAVTAEKLTARVVQFVKDHPAAAVIVVLCVLLVVIMQSCSSSLAAIGNGITGSVAATTYPAEDADLLGAEAAYTGLEADLQNLLDNYEATHSYDEYNFDLDEIEHDPYVLLSILSALHPEGWTLADVQGELQALFDRQYILTEDVVTETRYATETNADGEEVEVAYDYTICTVTLENFNLSHLPVYIMGEDALSRYSLYMAALGNRPDLFPSSAFVNKYGSPVARYEIPPEALSDETFAAMITEAEKYLGYPYVWGGSSPSTSFDCSGFVSWVVNHCGQGWSVGRLGATGLYNICTPVSSANAKPGDLIFFQGTYDTAGMSHVGIYVGDGMMLHCGDPIQYANINTSYWQSHFAAFGRLP